MYKKKIVEKVIALKCYLNWNLIRLFFHPSGKKEKNEINVEEPLNENTYEIERITYTND